MLKITSTVEEFLQWNSLVSLRLVHDGRLMCDLVDRDCGADVMSMNSCVDGENLLETGFEENKKGTYSLSQ